MPVIKILAHGATAGIAPARKPHSSAQRGDTTGWSVSATRRNTAFLRSVDHDELSGWGFAATLTLRNCPKTPDDWQRLRKNFFDRLRRMGMIRMHWVVEWQRRRVPHLHLAIWFPDDSEYGPDVIAHWIEAAKEYRPAFASQTAVPITHFGGWAQYVAKHSARGAGHYQRNAASRPKGWESSGRVWGKSGRWVLIDPIRLEMPPAAFYALRRVVRGWRKANASLSGKSRQIKSARTMLKCPDRKLSEVRGISEWIPKVVMISLANWLRSSGHHVMECPSANERIATRLQEGIEAISKVIS